MGSLLSPKLSCYIGAWNVRTMFKTGKVAQVEREFLPKETWRRTILKEAKELGK